MLFELVYMSQANHLFNQEELLDLLVAARANNIKRNLTGMLLYDGMGNFIQAIEGEKKEVDALYEVISQDERHSCLQKLFYTEIKRRQFKDWNMAFQVDSKDKASNIPGFSNFLQNKELLDARDGYAMDMLNHFKMRVTQQN